MISNDIIADNGLGANVSLNETSKRDLQPRLYLYRHKGRPAKWIIIHRGRQRHIGRSESERDLAEQDLERFKAGRYVRRRAPKRPRHQHSRADWGRIYFMTCKTDGFPIKIGFSRDPESRRRSLQCGMPWSVIVLATCYGPRSRESRIHRYFADIRLNGEWFSRTPELMDFIARVSTGGDVVDNYEPVKPLVRRRRPQSTSELRP